MMTTLLWKRKMKLPNKKNVEYEERRKQIKSLLKEGKTHKEISEVLGLTQPAISMWIKRWL